MATIVAAAGGGNWQTDATWVGGSKPTAADDVQLDATSGNVTIDSDAVCRSLDCNGYTGTLTHTAGVTLSIGDGTAGTGNRALRLASGMTYTLGSASTSLISFVSTSGTQQTIDLGGKTAGYLNHNGIGGSWSYTSAVTAYALTLVRTTLDLSSAGTVSLSFFYTSYPVARTLTLGSVSITLSLAGTAWDASTATNLTVTANTATVTLTSATSGVALGTKNWNGLSFVFPGAAGTTTVTGNATIGSLTKTATAACTLALPTSSGITATAFNVNGSAGQLLTLTGDVTVASGRIVCSYLNISNSDASGGATFLAGRTSTDGGSNTGWQFVDLVTATMAAPLGTLTGALAGTIIHPATMAAPLGGLTGAINGTIVHPAVMAAPLGALAAAMTAAGRGPTPATSAPTVTGAATSTPEAA